MRGAALTQRPRGTPTVSIVIPCYNYARFVGAAIDSALSQIGVAVEVLVVDDASSDDSAGVVSKIARRDPRVRLISNETNQGAVATFNNGLAMATGEFLIRLDADDLLTPGSAARAAALFEQFPRVGLVYGHPLHFESAAIPPHRDIATTWDIREGRSWLELRCNRGVNCITSPEVMMRKSVVDRVGGQQRLTHTHDMEMWMRIALESDVGWIGGADQAWHREHPASMSATEVSVMVDLDQRKAAFETLFTGRFGEPTENARMWGIARSALAEEALARACAAYGKGRGGSAETDELIAFARSLNVDLDALPHSRAFRATQSAGPRRSRFSPTVLASAAAYVVKRTAIHREWSRLGL